MKKLFMMFATLIMSLGFAVNVMAAPSPDLYDKTTADTEEDNYYREDDKKKDKSSTSPKTDDQGAPASLVYIALAAAAMSVYAAKRMKEQY
jgi:hypothetical protein